MIAIQQSERNGAAAATLVHADDEIMLITELAAYQQHTGGRFVNWAGQPAK